MRVVPAEWERQRCVMLSFPHEDTDWGDDLSSAIVPFIRMAQAIAFSTPVYIICKSRADIEHHFCSKQNLSFIEIPTNDTWIRDYGYISVRDGGEIGLLDFVFDGWGGKFESTLDNSVNSILHKKGYFGLTELESIDMVLEGGSIESDGEGTILTTTKCLCNPNRNGGLGKLEVEDRLHKYLGVERVLWLEHGYLAGDDTDSHIDTLARFVNPETIMYVNCSDKSDSHYEELTLMKAELEELRTKSGNPYRLIPLPMCEAKYNQEGERLPATYANFLITNGAVVYPTYRDKSDKVVGDILREFFEGREIIPIDCTKLIEQGGSLHCSTMGVFS